MRKQTNEWFILAILITCFVPVVIDSTVLHMAIPSLTFDLKASGNQVLWTIDIYSLIMAGLLLPMGVLGDKFGHKRMLFWGVAVFSLASLSAGFSQSASQLIASRSLLAVGGSMIMPTTLAIIRQTFQDDRKRAIALGIWVVFANGGAAIGPLFGGVLIDMISWRAVFLINIPVLIFILPFVAKKLPLSIVNPKQSWNIKSALVFLTAIIMLVYFFKNTFKAGTNITSSVLIGVIGLVLLGVFIQSQRKSETPMLDKALISDKRVQIGMVFTLIPMLITSGFELLLSQELQLVHGISPLQTAMYITPFFIAFAAPGISSRWFMKNLGIYMSLIFGLVISAAAFILLGFTDFATISAWLVFLLFVSGFGLGLVMLTASYTIMSAADNENAGTAGSLESTAYEMGVGLGVTFFGVMLSQIFAKTLRLPVELAQSLPKEVYYSINDALVIANDLGGEKRQLIRDAALPAFEQAHSYILISAGVIALLFIIYLVRNRKVFSSHCPTLKMRFLRQYIARIRQAECKRKSTASLQTDRREYTMIKKD